MNLGLVPYGEAFELQRSVAGAVSQGAVPETVILLEHPPVVTIGRRTEAGLELHIPEDAEVEIAETDRGGKSTFHGPGQLVCYPILDLTKHGKDVKRYVRDLEEALIRTLAAFGLEGTTVRRPDRRLDAARGRAGAEEDRVDRSARLALGDDARVRAQRRPRSRPVHRVDHRVRARGRAVHDDGTRARPPRHRRGRAARRGRGDRRRLRAAARRDPRRRRRAASGRSRFTHRWQRGDRRHPPASRVPAGIRCRETGSSALRAAYSYARRHSSLRSCDSRSTRRSTHMRVSATPSSYASKAKASPPSPTRRCRCERVSRCVGRRTSSTASGRRARP